MDTVRPIRGDIDKRVLDLLLGAAEQPGRGDRLWRAAAALGITEAAAAPAEAARMVTFWPEVRFSHRSSARRSTTRRPRLPVGRDYQQASHSARGRGGLLTLA
jgi:hypothetical protein